MKSRYSKYLYILASLSLLRNSQNICMEQQVYTKTKTPNIGSIGIFLDKNNTDNKSTVNLKIQSHNSNKPLNQIGITQESLEIENRQKALRILSILPGLEKQIKFYNPQEFLDFYKEFNTFFINHPEIQAQIDKTLNSENKQKIYDLSKILNAYDFAKNYKNIKEALTKVNITWLHAENKLLSLENDKSFEKLSQTEQEYIKNEIEIIKNQNKFVKIAANLVKNYDSKKYSKQEKKEILKIYILCEQNSKFKSKLRFNESQLNIQDLYIATTQIIVKNSKKLLDKNKLDIKTAANLEKMFELAYGLKNTFSENKNTKEIYQQLSEKYESIKKLKESKGICFNFKDLIKIEKRLGIDSKYLLEQNTNDIFKINPINQIKSNLINKLAEICEISQDLNPEGISFIKNIIEYTKALEQAGKNEEANDLLNCLDKNSISSFFSGALNEGLKQSGEAIASTVVGAGIFQLAKKLAPEFIKSNVTKIIASKAALPLQVILTLYNIYQDADILHKDIKDLLNSFKNGNAYELGQSSIRLTKDLTCAILCLKDIFKHAKKTNTLDQVSHLVDESKEINNFTKSNEFKKAQENTNEALCKLHLEKFKKARVNRENAKIHKITREEFEEYFPELKKHIEASELANELLIGNYIIIPDEFIDLQGNIIKNKIPKLVITPETVAHTLEPTVICVNGNDFTISGFHSDHNGKILTSNLLNYNNIVKSSNGCWKADVSFKKGTYKKPCSFFPNEWSEKEVFKNTISSLNYLQNIPQVQNNGNILFKSQIIINNKEYNFETIIKSENGNIITIYPIVE